MKTLKKIRKKNWRKYGFDFFSIFVAVLSAFALNNWNSARQARETENKILIEIANGLVKDLQDIEENKMGHQQGIYACKYFKSIAAAQTVSKDSSVLTHYVHLTKDFTSIQNKAGYETLRSQGLELIKNDALRQAIISLYEVDYQILRKLEEEYAEMQFQENYFKDINKILASNFEFGVNSNLTGINTPLNVSNQEKNILLLYLLRIQVSRTFMISYYQKIARKVSDLQLKINIELNK
ncbi:MAG: hypothetical protein AAF693_18475 [Bacteroidota bacterium]